ncbi:zinc finger and BTB domain-containing protein 49-like [Penaeus chinensis]|uniref:zinc finger and BTB domain-containing protein 49-like n=1 Tax=Penaeus chinensis TaxID=139456 RepID=UPI001FB84728|nr:zinc finger and BTB domain-containing protein 49-like [Penaeus chinensis]XP_047487873.1 zinc finger and BTB domain-containing protein 49-like [Penaeus chinensis]
MEDECLSLTWNNHGATYRQTLSVLREENTLTDVTLACDGQKFAAHKLVLVTCSDYFRTILGDVPCQHPIVYMRGVAAKEMQALIDFMYTGQTDIPQKEVPTLLSTAEALQIKGLGVFTSGEEHNSEKNTPSRREKNYGNKKKRSEPLVLLNGSSGESANTANSKSSLAKSDQFLENLYSHHYAFMSSPKRRKTDDRTVLKSPEHIPNLGSEKQPLQEIPSSCSKENLQSSATPLNTGLLSDLFQPRDQRDQSSSHPPSSSCPATYTSVVTDSSHEHSLKESHNAFNSGSEAAKPRGQGLRPSRSPSGQQPVQDPRPEAKTTSPRALNYSLSSLGGSKEDFASSSPGHILDEPNGAHADTPEKLMKAEIKEEALDFSNTALSENLPNDSLTAALASNSIEEETRMYLDAFARSANLARPLPLEETQESASLDGRPYVCPICQKCFAKAAILKRHHLAHFRPYVCHLCTRSFTRREVLAEHLLEHNGADLRMPCPVCNMTIKRKRNLQAHIKVKHPDYYKQKIASRESLC